MGGVPKIGPTNCSIECLKATRPYEALGPHKQPQPIDRFWNPACAILCVKSSRSPKLDLGGGGFIWALNFLKDFYILSILECGDQCGDKGKRCEYLLAEQGLMLGFESLPFRHVSAWPEYIPNETSSCP